MTEDAFTTPIPRDRWGRPYIYPAPRRGETHADVVARFARQKKQPPTYRRATTFISVLEDTYQLELWKMRMVALGMGQREDLVLAASSLTADKADRSALNKIAKDAQEHARASAKATVGTALHRLCERLDRGQRVDNVPSAFVPDLEAYERVRDKAGLKFHQIETLRVFDKWEVAGTPDRIGTFGGKTMVIDIKTGDITWSEREIAMQLALYTHAVPYSHDTGRFEDVTEVNRIKGMVIHLPAGEGKCDLYEVDLVSGWEACNLAKQVWDWREREELFTPLSAEDSSKQGPLTYSEAAMACNTVDELRDLWSRAARDPRGALDEKVKRAIKLRLEQLERQSA